MRSLNGTSHAFDASSDKKRATIERRKEQKMQTERLKEQLEMNRKVASIRN
jgi:hypothetical protein